MPQLAVGQRVLQPHHNDTGNPVPPGTAGRVHRYHPATATAVIDWDNGLRQTVAGDVTLTLLTSAWTAALDAGPVWEQALAAARAAGEAAGSTAADWWCQDTIGGRATGDVVRRARSVVDAIDDDDSELLDSLPRCGLDQTEGSDSPAAADLAEILTGTDPGLRESMFTGRWQEAVDAYRDGFEDALLARVLQTCRIVISPTGDGRDLSHLHPRDIRPGRYGVFSGEWHLTSDDGPDRYRIGFAGILTGSWNGWAVFTCTRAVAEQIVADLDTRRDAERAALQASGIRRRADLNREINLRWPRLWFDGDVLVVDQRGQHRDRHAITRVTADLDGHYVVLGGDWCWEAVNPTDCDRIAGELPAVGRHQAWTRLRHTPGLRVPHDRLRVADVHRHTTGIGGRITASLLVDGIVIAGLVDDGGGGRLDSPVEAHHRQVLAAYTAASRHHGAPVGESRLLHALITEALLDQATARATSDGTALLRLIDGAGHTIALHPVAGAPQGQHGLRAISESLTAFYGATDAPTCWQIWTGRCWQDLPTTTP